MTTRGSNQEPQIERPSLEALGLIGWHAPRELPKSLTEETLQAELDRARRSVTPTSLAHLATAIDDLIVFGRAFDLLANGKPETIEVMSSVYGDALGELPSDLLFIAVDAVRAAWRWPRMPLPADVKSHVSEEFSSRKIVAYTLERALAHMRKPQTITGRRAPIAIGSTP